MFRISLMRSVHGRRLLVTTFNRRTLGDIFKETLKSFPILQTLERNTNN